MSGHRNLTSLLGFLNALVLGNPDCSWSSAIVLWLVRILTLGLMLRTYIIPSLLFLCSNHIRIRSISFRSIRGLYIRSKNRILHVDRIALGRLRMGSPSRRSILIEGLKVEIGLEDNKSPTKPATRTSRPSFILSDLSPYPLASTLISAVYCLLEPYFRPVIRSFFVSCFRLVIHRLPGITQAFEFELRSVEIIIVALPGTHLVIEETFLRTALTFTQLEVTQGMDYTDQSAKEKRGAKSFNLANWRARLIKSAKRTWDRAWGKTRGFASISLELKKVVGRTQPSLSVDDDQDSKTFFTLPGVMNLDASVCFSPKQATIEPHGLEMKLAIDPVYIAVDVLQSVVKLFMERSKSKYSGSEVDLSPSPPNSPFMQTLSASRSIASIRVQERLSRERCTPARLKDIKVVSSLSGFKAAKIEISSVNLIFHSGAGPGRQKIIYEMSLHTVAVGAHLSNYAESPLHREWLGRKTCSGDHMDPDTYAFNFSIAKLTVERTTKKYVPTSIPILTLGSIDLHVLMSQWPSPWLATSPFLVGDPNSPLLVIWLEVNSVKVTERVDFVQLLLAELISTRSRGTSFWHGHVRLPRVSVNIQCGSVCVSLICADSPRNDEAVVMELRSEGGVISGNSHFLSPPISRIASCDTTVECLPLHMKLVGSAILKPTFIKVRSTSIRSPGSYHRLWESNASSTDVFCEPVLSLESVEVTLDGNALGDVKDDTNDVASVAVSSTYLDIRLSTDALCLELWHPGVLSTLMEMRAIVPNHVKALDADSVKSTSFDSFPVGLSASLSFSRCVVFVVGQGLCPDDDLELSRGVAFRTGISIRYDSLRPHHAHRFRGLPAHWQRRHKLYLPDDRIAEAISSAKASNITHNSSTFLRIFVWDLALRDATATEYVADDPYISEKDDPALSGQDFLRIRKLRTDMCITSKANSMSGDVAHGACQVTTDVPYIWATFQLVHVYCSLLALRTLSSLLRGPIPSTPLAHPGTFSCRFQATIQTIQIFWNLPNHRLVTRIDLVSPYVCQGHSAGIRLSNMHVWVPVATQITRWQENKGEKWQELLRLNEWHVFLHLSDEPPAGVVIEGDSARFRIPFGFVLANMIQSIGLTVKGVRHLKQMISAGRFMTMTMPKAESAKSMPNLAFRLRCLCVEVADDPFECQLALIWRAGLEATKQRADREEAFGVKVATILADKSPNATSPIELDSEYQFHSKHSVTVENARQRLHRVHYFDWKLRHAELKTKRSSAEQATLRKLHNVHVLKAMKNIANLVEVTPVDDTPPLFRLMIDSLSLKVMPPSFRLCALPDFMYDLGNGLPRDTSFSLLLPMCLQLTLASLRACLRDYPIPLLDIPANTNDGGVGLDFESDLVIGEEMGTDKSVDWINCEITPAFSIMVPKTIMPIKTYANPNVNVMTTGITSLAWAVSISPAMQDVMRVVETLSSSPYDTSPMLAFWDKIRLVFHWKIKASFQGDVRLYMKGSRDPYNLQGSGAGFSICWKGSPKLFIGSKIEDKEQIQVVSDSMILAIPDFEADDFVLPERDKFQKDPDDTFRDFRSDFVHLSISLTSSVHGTGIGTLSSPSSLHLTPKAFAHFWSWWELFDAALSLPVRQGTYYPSRVVSPKFGRHLATLKYRISVSRLFVSHAYMDDSRESWSDGVTPFVGVKALIDQFTADMHQRDQETVVHGLHPDDIKVSRRKAFYAAEVVMKRLDLRASLAIFCDPLKQVVPISSPPNRSNYRTRNAMPSTDPQSHWIDHDDFVETDWKTSAVPIVHLMPIVDCPSFTYFKRCPNASIGRSEHLDRSKFGDEDTHICFLGKEESVTQIQIRLAMDRVSRLRETLKEPSYEAAGPYDNPPLDNFPSSDSTAQNRTPHDSQTLQKKLSLLEGYVSRLAEVDAASDNTQGGDAQAYYMPSDTVSPNDWAEFDNVYQIHCPKIYMDSAVRDIMLQYYNCSRVRRGYEYHMAARAVKFIRDQADAALASNVDSSEMRRVPASPAQAAAQALRKILTRDDDSKPSVDMSDGVPSQPPGIVDPLWGWADGVSLRKAHFCLLLKPQIVLRSESGVDSVCVLAAVQAKLQSFTIMDDSNIKDPVCGEVMSRSYTSLNGLQTFSPARTCLSSDGCVPLEVLIDYRCESNNFDRLVPQTEATFHYDKFNRLRLRNNVTSVIRTTPEQSALANNNHLQNQTDLVQVHIPSFTVSATDRHFQDISNIVTKLILFSDAAHKTRMEKLETLLFTYDFTDLSSAANVVADVQGRLRGALETERMAAQEYRNTGKPDRLEILKLKAYIFLLAEELNLLFDAIKLAQDQMDDQTDQKSALLLHASSVEISWRMLDENSRTFARLDVRDIDYFWLSRQDSSTVNNLTAGDLQAYDGSPNAVWTEILSKHGDPTNHPLLKRGLFILANWTVLAPVGGITIYEEFELNLHPMRLQVDAKVGTRIMEYVWPARKTRRQIRDRFNLTIAVDKTASVLAIPSPPRSSLDIPQTLTVRDEHRLPAPSLRKLGSSRSFTDLRSAASERLQIQSLQRTRSSQGLRSLSPDPDPVDGHEMQTRSASRWIRLRNSGDAAEMKTRSSQKSFVLVRISSLHLLLSIMKEESFECRDARIRTRDLEFRNQTWSFEELFNQFIPSDMGWRGWVKMAFHQPLIPVLPVARELISKTKWIGSKGASHLDVREHPDDQKSISAQGMEGDPIPPQSLSKRYWRKSHRISVSSGSLTSSTLTSEPESMADWTSRDSHNSSKAGSSKKSRSRVFRLFTHGSPPVSSASSTSSTRSQKSGNTSSVRVLFVTGGNI